MTNVSLSTQVTATTDRVRLTVSLAAMTQDPLAAALKAAAAQAVKKIIDRFAPMTVEVRENGAFHFVVADFAPDGDTVASAIRATRPLDAATDALADSELLHALCYAAL